MPQVIFDPSVFTSQTAKPMPVVLVLDNSGSMSGDKIKNLNDAVRDMLQTFKLSECAEASFSLAIFTFGTGIHLLQPLTDAGMIEWHDIPISDVNSSSNFTGKWDDSEARGTPLGRTLQIVKSMIEDKTIVPSRAYRPAIVLVSDGHPTDSWKASLASFIQEGRSSKCDRWAMAIGRDADAGVLTMFIDGQKNIDGSPRKLLYAGDSRSLKDNFKFITMSVTNSVALASKSKVLTVKPITVKETVINDLDGNLALMQEKKPLEEHGTEEESGFEW